MVSIYLAQALKEEKDTSKRVKNTIQRLVYIDDVVDCFFVSCLNNEASIGQGDKYRNRPKNNGRAVAGVNKREVQARDPSRDL